MQHHRTASALALAGLLTLGTGSVALAEESDSSGNAAATTDEQARISDPKLEKFTLALADVRRIRTEYGPKLQQADSREKRTQLKKTGQQEMIQAIRDSGLELKEYNRIGNRLGSDQELQQRMKQMMEKQQG